jgi:hypothetical protein
MKKPQSSRNYGLALAALLLGSASWAFAQTPNFYVNCFDYGAASVAAGGMTTGNGTSPCGVAYNGIASILTWDNTQNSTLNNDPDPNIITGGGGGSCYCYADMTQQSTIDDFFCGYPYDNPWYAGNPAGVDLAQYVAVHFDILWDTVNSTITIDQFNNVSALPSPPLQSWAGTFTGGLSAYMAGSDPNVNGLDIQNCGSGSVNTLGYINIPVGAASGWVTVTLPINQSQTGLSGTSGIFLKKWLSQPWGFNSPMVAAFWIDNVWFEGTAAPPPPPTIKSLTTTTPGLNLVFNTAGINDRHEVALVSTNGLSWVGNTGSSPVTYSFTISGFPQTTAAQWSTAAYLMMSPNPANLDNALDWNETNGVVAWLQQGPTTSTMTLSYKVNHPGGAVGTQIGSVTYTGKALGRWQIQFTSDQGGVLIAPDGITQSAFAFPAGGDEAMFAENPALGHPGMYLYLGAQVNNSATLNQAVCYSQFSVTGVPSAQSDNFLTDPVLNTNVWMNGPGSGSPAANFVMTNNAAYWVTWSTPASGYTLQITPNLLGTWTPDTTDTVINGAGAKLELVTTPNLPAGPNAFFRLSNP